MSYGKPCISSAAGPPGAPPADTLAIACDSGAVKPHVDRRYALADAAQAHRDLESRNTTGSLLLLP